MTVMQSPSNRKPFAAGGKYLIFSLCGEEYGIEVLKVREIIGVPEITRVPQMPHHVKGVINLRGKVIPVIDLRVMLGLPPDSETSPSEKTHSRGPEGPQGTGTVANPYSGQTCTIVLDAGSPTGVIVDKVREVLDIDEQQIDPPPPLGGGENASCIVGLAQVRGDVKILLDIDKLLGCDKAD